MHVEHDVQAVVLRLVDRLLDVGDVAASSLPRSGSSADHEMFEAHDVEALLGDAGEVVVGERLGRRHLGPRTVEVDELVHVDAAEQHLVAVAVRDDVAVRAQEARGHALLVRRGCGRHPGRA